MGRPTDEQIRRLEAFQASGAMDHECREAVDQALLSAYVVRELSYLIGKFFPSDMTGLFEHSNKLHESLWHSLNMKCAGFHPEKF